MIESNEDFAKRLSYVSGKAYGPYPGTCLDQMAEPYGLKRHVVYLPAVSCRFYWEDGRMTWESVLPERDDSMPRSWKVRTALMDLPLLESTGRWRLDSVIHTFESREYYYPEGFIGPHQALEYHACTVPRTLTNVEISGVVVV